jgi:pyruvate dehydrogenase E1 component alpha subunit/2-oxoisovalerate dehydrogenase E1 component alpha subunit
MTTRVPTGGKRAARDGKRLETTYPAGLTRAQVLELYYWMRLTRTLEERLVALYRQTKVVG